MTSVVRLVELMHSTYKFNSIDISETSLTLNRKLWALKTRFCAWQFELETIASSSDASSHRPATYRADVVNRGLISRDDVKRQPGQVQTINCIEVSDSNEWYRLAPFHYTNTVTRRGLQIEINSRVKTLGTVASALNF